MFLKLNLVVKFKVCELKFNFEVIQFMDLYFLLLVSHLLFCDSPENALVKVLNIHYLTLRLRLILIGFTSKN